jgi:hypothetical protein
MLMQQNKLFDKKISNYQSRRPQQCSIKPVSSRFREQVPATDIKKAIARKVAFTAAPASHTFKGEINDA